MLATFRSKAQQPGSRGQTGPASRDAAGIISAIDRVMAVIEFNPDGTIITANENFSAAMGYTPLRDPEPPPPHVR